jgi:hypothetical protein
MLIGGYAVNAFGYVRNTVDMDIWIASDPDNLQRSFVPFATSRSLPHRTTFSTNRTRWYGWDCRRCVLRCPGTSPAWNSTAAVSDEDCWPRRVTIDDDDLRIPAISLQDLKRNKLAAGRKNDLLDLDELS